jgi:hypothetical protein
MSIYKKLQEARIMLQNTQLKKSGHNKFAGYYYFELGDFLPDIQKICSKLGLCGMVSFTPEMAYLNIHDTEDGSFTTFTSPMSSAALKGCHDVQNLGAVQTYLRRYLWVNAFEIVEHDALDATLGAEDKPVKTYTGGKPAYVKPVGATPVVKASDPVAAPATIVAKPATKEWTLTPTGDVGTDAWVEGIKAGVSTVLELATKPEDVANIFKNNRVMFDKLKETNEQVYSDLMSQFSTVKKSLTKE